MTIAEESAARRIVGGVDTHKDLHVAAVVDEQDRVLTIFKADPEATQVLHGLLGSLKKNEIMSSYGLDEKKYAAAMKRIRVKLLGRRNGGGRGEKHGR